VGQQSVFALRIFSRVFTACDATTSENGNKAERLGAWESRVPAMLLGWYFDCKIGATYDLMCFMISLA
jgi:hypothetical protein